MTSGACRWGAAPTPAGRGGRHAGPLVGGRPHGHGHLVVASARVLDHDNRTVTVAIPAERVDDVAAALGGGDLLTALVPD